MNCPNCQKPITCGCQQRTASDGTKVCASCLGSYEQGLLLVGQAQVVLANPHPQR